MKKKILLVMPLMATSFLLGCNGGGNEPEAVNFSITDSSISYDGINKTAVLHLNWTPSEHSLEFSNFTFTYNGDKTAQKVEQGDVTARPREITITFNEELINDVTDGKLSFHYVDNTTKTENEGKVGKIKINVAERPTFSITDTKVAYNSIENTAVVHLDWTLPDHLIEFSDFTFTYGEGKSAGKVEQGDTIKRPREITITFEEGLLDSVTGSLNFHYIDSTAKIKSEGKVEGILINVPEKPDFYAVDTSVIYNSIDKNTTVSIDWTQDKYSLELSDFEFRYNEGLKRITGIYASAGQPCKVTIPLLEKPVGNITDGELTFHYKDKTVAKIEGDGKVEGIHVNIPENPGFSITKSLAFYDSKNKTAKVSVDWAPKDRLMEFSNASFSYNSGAGTATVSVTGDKRPREFTINFASGLASNITDGELKFDYVDKTAQIKGKQTFSNIQIVLPFMVTCTSKEVELSNYSATGLEDYKTTITVKSSVINNGYTIPDTLKNITVGKTSLEATQYTYIPTENTFSAELTIPKEIITGAINIDLAIKELTPLCFENLRDAQNSISCHITGVIDPDTIDIKYCKDLTTSNWQDWPKDAEEVTLRPLWINKDEKVYIKNTKNTLTPGDGQGYFCFVADEIKISGNVNSMVNYAALTPYCFERLFEAIGSKTTGAPALPATTLAEGCYENMFNSYDNLTEAPALPATTLTDRCYYGMFNGCSKLTKAPKLPATTLTKHCYQDMFYNCSKLTEAPNLPATTLDKYCYFGMFGKSGIINAPELIATRLAECCYQSMFNECDSLTKAPNLPATTLTEHCYDGMFMGCDSLVTAPNQLPAIKLTASCYENMFRDCKALLKAPELPAASSGLAYYCYYLMFAGCSNLNYIKVGFGTPGSLTWPGNSATKQWLAGVQFSEGSFYWKGGISGPIERSENTVPIGWNINPK